MVKLGINIDHVATLRQQRLELDPSPLEAALVCERAGADGITAHLREDRRHIQESDILLLRKTIRTKLNLEMAATSGMVAFAVKIKPDDVCLVPEKRQELTTEGGLNVASQKKKLEKIVSKLKAARIKVSIFIDPDEIQVKAAKQIGADAVELHAGKYAENYRKFGASSQKCLKELVRLKSAGRLAKTFGLTLNAGHGLDYKNVMEVAAIPGMNELNIGFSIVSRAVFAGIEQAVVEMKQLIK